MNGTRPGADYFKPIRYCAGWAFCRAAAHIGHRYVHLPVFPNRAFALAKAGYVW